MNIMRGDRVVLIKEHEKMKMVGAIVEVGNITESFIVLRNPKTKVAIAAVDIDEFYKYFKPELKSWTPWTELIIVDGVNNQQIGWYRTNHKKVQVKLNNGIRAEATCNKTDEFNLYTGVNIAVNRCNEKLVKQLIEDTQKRLKESSNQLKELSAECKDIKVKINNLIKQVKPLASTSDEGNIKNT